MWHHSFANWIPSGTYTRQTIRTVDITKDEYRNLSSEHNQSEYENTHTVLRWTGPGGLFFEAVLPNGKEIMFHLNAIVTLLRLLTLKKGIQYRTTWFFHGYFRRIPCHPKAFRINFLIECVRAYDKRRNTEVLLRKRQNYDVCLSTAIHPSFQFNLNSTVSYISLQ